MSSYNTSKAINGYICQQVEKPKDEIETAVVCFLILLIPVMKG